VRTTTTAFTTICSMQSNCNQIHAYGHGQHTSMNSNYKQRMIGIEQDTHANATTHHEHRNPFRFCFARQQQTFMISKFRMPTKISYTNILQMPAKQSASAQECLKRNTMVYVRACTLNIDTLG
jgi:hypothetical protein